MEAHIRKNWTNCNDLVDLGQQLAIFKTHAHHTHCKFNDKYSLPLLSLLIKEKKNFPTHFDG